MEWRTRLRKLVNRPDELSSWRMALMRFIDPMEWYVRKDDSHRSHGPRRSQHAGWTSFEQLELAERGEPNHPYDWIGAMVLIVAFVGSVIL